MNSRGLRSFLHLFAFIVSSVAGFAQVGPGAPSVVYSPPITRVEGPQPYTLQLPITVRSPSNVPVGSNVTISPVVTVLAKPSGVSDATALSYVTISPATLTFTGPNQTLTFNFRAVFPDGTSVGSYGYKMQTAGWPLAVQDQGAFVNVDVFPKVTAGPPTVSIVTPADQSSFSFQPLVTPTLSIPITFTAASAAGVPLTNIEADIGGGLLPLTVTVNPDGTRTVNTTATISTPGIYTIRARASNEFGTAFDTSDFTVTVSGPPPTVSIAQPTATTYTLPQSGPLSVPFSFTGRSNWRGITSLVATLNDQPVVFTPSGLNTLTATGTGNFSITTGGSYTLVVTATDLLGTATARTTFTVAAPLPPPAITISQPLNGAVFTRVAGSAATLIPFSFTGVAGTGTTITSLTGSLNGNAVTATVTGLNTATATGTGNLSVTGPGTYTLSATTRTSSGTASTSVTFTVNETQPPAPTCGVNWLPPISLGCTIKGGSKLPIKFELDCGENTCPGNGNDKDRSCRDDDDDDSDCDYDWNNDGDRDFYPGQRTKSKTNIDKTVIIAVTDLTANTAAKLYRYGQYDIQGRDMYILNFRTQSGARRYRVEVYSTATGSVVLYGSREFVTR
jgi:hypothetical protein